MKKLSVIVAAVLRRHVVVNVAGLVKIAKTTEKSTQMGTASDALDVGGIDDTGGDNLFTDHSRAA
jgi:hypothetical protein